MAVVTVAGRDITCFTVVHSDCPTGSFAADELSAYIGKITGTPLKTSLPDCAPEDNVIRFVKDEALAEEEYRITVAPGKVIIAGGSPRGVLYGVYGFLEKLGVRFFMPQVEVLGSGADVAIDEGEWGDKPYFEYRQSDWRCGEDPLWSVRNRINSRYTISDTMGGYVKWAGFVHTMEAITGVPQNAQPCFSDPETLEKAIKYVRGILEKDPTVKIISVSQNDNCNYCKCEKCTAVDNEEESHMGSLLRLVNAVADDIKDDYPDVKIDTLAYQFTRKAPKITKPRPNVNIRLCSIECCFSHTLDDSSCEANRAFRKDIEDWNKICNTLYIWDYVTNFCHYIPTFPNIQVLRDNMRFFAEHGVQGMYPEGNYNSPASGEFGELRCYLLAKLMANPFMSEVEYNTHIDEFLAAYYGEGWRYIRAYLDLMVEEARKKHMNIWLRPLELFDRDILDALAPTIESWWNAAEAYAGDRLEAVKRSRFQWTYISLCLKPDAKKGEKFFNDVTKAGVRWNEWKDVRNVADFSIEPNEWEERY